MSELVRRQSSMADTISFVELRQIQDREIRIEYSGTVSCQARSN